MITPGISSPKGKPWCLSSASISFLFFSILTFVLHFGPEEATAPHKNRMKLCHSEPSAHTLPSPVDSIPSWFKSSVDDLTHPGDASVLRHFTLQFSSRTPQSDVIKNAHKSCLIMIQNCMPSSAPWLRKMFTHSRGRTQTCSTIPQMWVWETPVSWSSDLHLHMGGATNFEALKGRGYI